jgi:hypothetical protein
VVARADRYPELTDGTAARRSGDARAPGAESSRATGFSGKPDVGEPFEQDPNHDLTMEATSPTSRSNGTSRPKALTATTQFDRRQGTTARRRPSPAQSKTDGSTATVGLDWPTRFGPRRRDQLDRALVRLATHGRLIAESRSDALRVSCQMADSRSKIRPVRLRDLFMLYLSTGSSDSLWI